MLASEAGAAAGGRSSVERVQAGDVPVLPGLGSGGRRTSPKFGASSRHRDQTRPTHLPPLRASPKHPTFVLAKPRSSSVSQDLEQVQGSEDEKWGFFLVFAWAWAGPFLLLLLSWG